MDIRRSWRSIEPTELALTSTHQLPSLRTDDSPRPFRNSDRDGYRDAYDNCRRKASTMTPLDVVLADIATLETAREALPSHSHTSALFSLTLFRLEDEAEALHRVALKRAA